MLQHRDIVRSKKSGSTGVVLQTISLLREDGPLSVIFEGSGAGVVIEDENDYEVIGHENPVAEFDGCGVGKGEKACVFCAAGPNGLECVRHTELHWNLMFNIAKERRLREPTELYPKCKL